MMDALAGGFADPPIDAARAFRTVLDAMAHPGRLAHLSAAAAPGLSSAAASVVLVLIDGDTPLWLAPALRTPELTRWLAFHTGAPLVEDKANAAFALGDWPALAPVGAYCVGTPEYPDRSATLIAEVPALEGDTRLTGPGIETEARLALPDPEALAANAALYPLGLDLILTSGDRIAALPRSTRIG